MAQDDITLIGKGIRIKGEITGTASIEVWGTVDGTAGTEGTFRVREGGQVDGEIATREVVVDGKVQGLIAAEQKIALNASSRVQGEIKAKSVSIAEGAHFEGNVKMPKG